jgi:hypothetical protein
VSEQELGPALQPDREVIAFPVIFDALGGDHVKLFFQRAQVVGPPDHGPVAQSKDEVAEPKVVHHEVL